VEYEDTRTIATPEGVELRLRLAGVGSRFAAALIDALIKAGILLTVVIAAALLGGGLSALVAFGIGLLFAMVFFDVLFEVRSGGRTPGKRTLGLRVVQTDGSPVGLRASAVRNVLRLVEGLPLSYLPAIVSILVTRDNQRLGDLAAGTLVVQESSVPRPVAPFRPPVAPAHAADWDVSAVTPEELAAVRSFIARRHDFTPDARAALAERLATALQARVAGARPGMPPERFLEELEAVKSARR
jgi:uncharacterized RDD family membrane protein YckC